MEKRKADEVTAAASDEKRARGLGNGASWLREILFGDDSSTWATMARSKGAEDQATMAEHVKAAGLRASLVANPRDGVCIYTQSDKAATVADRPAMEQMVWAMFGLHPDNFSLEDTFQELRSRYVALRLARRFASIDLVQRQPSALAAAQALEVAALNFTTNDDDDVGADGASSSMWAAKVEEELLPALAAVGLGSRAISNEVAAEHFRNDTLPNALLGRYLEASKVRIHDITVNVPADIKFRRLNVSFYDPSDYRPPAPFLFKPALALILDTSPTPSSESGVGRLLTAFTECFWKELSAGGYIPPQELVDASSLPLKTWASSGITLPSGTVIPLAATFEPREPLSLWLHGAPGAGKSSFVRHLVPALNLAVNRFLDPQMEVRFVKHNLNKPLRELKHELQLRPNNNDLSVMSIIQGRRMTFSQTKRGLVVIGLEEVPCAAEDAATVAASALQGGGGNGDHPSAEKGAEGDDEEYDDDDEQMEQFLTLEHLCERFKGIDNDATLVPVFTSNYHLRAPGYGAMKALKMFKDTIVVELSGVTGTARSGLAGRLLTDLLAAQTTRLTTTSSTSSAPPIQWAAPVLEDSFELGDGDTRPLLLKLRVVAYFATRLALSLKPADSPSSGGALTLSVGQSKDDHRVALSLRHASSSSSSPPLLAPPLYLSRGGGACLFPDTNTPPSSGVQGGFDAHALLDARAAAIHASLEALPETVNPRTLHELGQVCDYFFKGALAPAVVVVCGKPNLANSLVDLLAGSVPQESPNVVVPYCSALRDIDPEQVKMAKSLYDAHSTRNLRDEIISASKKPNHDGLVAVELVCSSLESQLLIRELVEDSPSLTAFSTNKSALEKTGLFFVVSLVDCALTPELASRASVVVQ